MRFCYITSNSDQTVESKRESFVLIDVFIPSFFERFGTFKVWVIQYSAWTPTFENLKRYRYAKAATNKRT